MPMNDDVRAAGEALREQGRAVAQDVRRPLLAVVGVGELAVTGLRAQLRDWPTGTHEQVRRLSGKAGELRNRVRDLDPASVRDNMETYLAQARSVYESLAERGEQVIARRVPQARSESAGTEPAQLAEGRGADATGAEDTADAEPGDDPAESN